MISDEEWVKIHAQLVSSFLRVARGQHTAAAQKVVFEVAGVQSEQMHALYMSPEVWDKAVKPALDRWDKENTATPTKLVTP